MEYTGRTEVGGRPAVRNLGTLTLHKLAVGPLDNNVYLLQGRSGTRLLVDAAAEAPTIRGRLLPDDRCDFIVTTHRHQDHWAALADVLTATAATTLAGAQDAEGIDVPTDQLLHHGDIIDLDGTPIMVLELRGHTPGGVALAFADDTGRQHLITGDSLFPGGVGRTTPETFDQLLDDVVARVFDVYDDDTWIYPGHGWDTTLGAERRHLDEWRKRRW
jgi:glyoxylase-like metal-dependent hydrolase (beta-lactamase superfamily II)